MKRVAITAAAAVILSAMSACSPTDATPGRAVGTAPMVEDDRLETYVRARFQSDAALRGYDLDVSADNGRVTVSGNVPNEEARQQVLRASRDVAGVQAVDDRMAVRTAPMAPLAEAPPRSPAATGTDGPNPTWITTKIRAQYFLSPEIKPWNIDVTTTAGGVVTLSGRVDETQDRDEAVRIARATDGVKSVEDRLTVGAASSTETTGTAADADAGDAWITAKVQAQYFLDTDVKGREIDVDTRNGTVTLSGTVESEAQRRQALMIARNTDGVREVTDRLTVTAPAADPDRPGTVERAAAAADDAWITMKIQSKYFMDRDIKGSTVDVTTNGGVVTLRGSVASDAERKSAEQIAMETDGVRRVDNQLTVRTTTR